MLRQKMLRDMQQNKWQFFSILLMAFLGVYIFTGIGGEWAGVENYREKYYEETNLADGWIWGEGFTDDDLETVKSIDGVTGAEKRCYLEVTGQDEYSPSVYLYALNENLICMPLVIEGEEVDVNAEGKMWLDTRFAEAKGLEVGDSYTFLFESTPITLKVAGLVYSSEYQYYADDNDLWPDYNKIGFAYCSYRSIPIKDYLINYIKSSDKTVNELVEEFSEETEEIKNYSNLLKGLSKESIINILEKTDSEKFIDMLPYTQIIFTSSTDASQLSQMIDEALNGNYSVYTTRSETEGITMLDSEMSQHKMMGSVFPIVFMLIAILAIITSMNRLAASQRTQIGTLKALGFGNSKITMHYVGYGFWTSLIGAVLGLIAGPLTLPYLFYESMTSYYTLPEWKSGFDISFIFAVIGTVLACTLTTFLTVYSMLGESPALTLRPKAPKNIRLSKIERTAGWQKLSFGFRRAHRDLSRGKARTVMGIVGTIGCMALLICAFSVKDCMNDMEKWMYEEIQVQQTRLTLNSEATIQDAEAIAQDIDGEIIMTSAIEVRANGVKKTQTVTVTDGSGCFYITDASRNQIIPDDDTVALSKKTADALGVKEGDEFEWHIYTSDTWVKSKVTVISRTPMNQGLVITRGTLEELGYTFTPTYVDTLQSLADYESEYVASVATAEDMQNFWDNYMETMNTMVAVLIFFAVLLAGVVLYNLGKISFTQQERENATLKVIGFPTGKILSLSVIQSFILSLAGVILGVPGGLALTYAMFSTSGDEFDIMINLTPSSFIICTAITIGVSLLVSLLFIKPIKRLDMVTSLKSVE